MAETYQEKRRRAARAQHAAMAARPVKWGTCSVCGIAKPVNTRGLIYRHGFDYQRQEYCAGALKPPREESAVLAGGGEESE